VIADGVAVPGGLEPPTNGLGNRCSVLLSYGTCQDFQALSGRGSEALHSACTQNGLAH
jgi:hypothetical protein